MSVAIQSYVFRASLGLVSGATRECSEPLRHFVSDSDFLKGLRSSSEFIGFRVLRSPGEGLRRPSEFFGVQRASLYLSSVPLGSACPCVSQVLRASSGSVVVLERFVWFFKVIRTSLTLSWLLWGSAEL